MGNEQSALSDGDPGHINAYGFHVLRNTSSAEGVKDIEPWYDFIVGINGHQVVCLFLCKFGYWDVKLMYSYRTRILTYLFEKSRIVRVGP